jgi:phosphatidate phosphatase APP1
MPSFKKTILTGLHTIERGIDKTRLNVKNKLGGNRDLMVMPYRGFGTQDWLWFKGRVLENQDLTPPSETSSTWQNFRNTVERLRTDELPGAEVTAEFRGKTQTATADDEGYFDYTIQKGEHYPESRHRWVEVPVHISGGKAPKETHGTSATAQVLIPSQDAQFGVISDIDDTVLKTGATNKIRMWKMTFLHNAGTRLPFKGVSALYRALEKGTSTQPHNPFFFVSSSSWNLYDMLVDFFELKNIPKGPLMLRDWGLDNTKFIASGHDHKLQKIRKILNAYPHIPFLLIGDSGQHDPELFAQIVRESPDRILAIFIRHLPGKKKRTAQIHRLTNQLHDETGVHLHLVEDSAQAAEIAIKNGWITSETQNPIHEETEKDNEQ